eukprot:12561049-Alexandrium_andersonii.AAC.1
MPACRTRRYIIREAALRPPDEQVQLGRGALCERSTALAICTRKIPTVAKDGLHMANPSPPSGASGARWRR